MRVFAMWLLVAACLAAQSADARLLREFDALMKQGAAAGETDPAAAREAADAWKRQLDAFVDSWRPEAATLKEGRWIFAKALLLAGKPAEAAPLLEAFCREHPGHEDFEDAWMSHASARLEMGEPARAKALLETFLKERPTSTRAIPARYYLGIALSALLEDAAAIEAFDVVVRDGGRHPLVADANLKALSTLAESGRVADARTRLAPLRKEYPDAPALIALGEQFDAIGRPVSGVTDSVRWISGTHPLAFDRGRPTVVVFFADFYESSVEELGRVNGVAAGLAEKGVDVIAFTKRYRAKSRTEDEEAAILKTFVDGRGITFPVAMLSGEATLRSWGVRGLPHVVVIGRDGKVVGLKVGAARRDPRSAALLGRMVDRALSVPRAPVDGGR